MRYLLKDLWDAFIRAFKFFFRGQEIKFESAPKAVEYSAKYMTCSCEKKSVSVAVISSLNDLPEKNGLRLCQIDLAFRGRVELALAHIGPEYFSKFKNWGFCFDRGR